MDKNIKVLLLQCNESPTDELIKQIFIKNNKLRSNYTRLIPTYLNIFAYITTKFSDSTNIQENLFRINYDITELPKCKQCGNNVQFVSFNKGYNNFCCSHCARINETTLNKKKATKLQRYGNENYNNCEKAKQTCLYRYGNENYRNIEKIKQTCILKYGVENCMQDNKVKEKMHVTKFLRYGDMYYNNPEKYKQTCMKKYGVCNFFKQRNIQEIFKKIKMQKYNNPTYNNTNKAKRTCIERYGVSNPMQAIWFKEKFVQSMQKKYHVNYTGQSAELMEKYRQTCIKRYGEIHPMKTLQMRQNASIIMQTPEIQQKIKNTKKLNNSYNRSKIEREFEQYLDIKQIDYITQYSSNEYPFNCDFYLPSYKLYIEIQGNWTHGKHPFNKNSKDDIAYLNILKEKVNNKVTNKKIYAEDVIQTWTIRDPNKRNIAKLHNLNYLEIFTINIQKAINIFENKIRDIKQ